MHLDDLNLIKELDSENMLQHINNLPDQLAGAWEIGLKLPLPDFKEFHHVVIAGMGGSAIGGDLVKAYAQQFSHIPITVLRDYDLPNWSKTLVICSSHSGNTEETLSVFDQAVEAGLPTLPICTGGKLAEKAGETGSALWIFEDDFQPRAAVGFSFGLLLAALTRLGMFPLEETSEQIKNTAAAMKTQMTNLQPEVPAPTNPAKRLAGQFVNRWITIFGAGFLAPVARRWKTQINEIAKAQASFEVIPEANHNTLQGAYFPEVNVNHSLNFFITSKHNHRRNQIREEYTRKTFMLEAFATDFYRTHGKSVMEDMWTALHMGDYISYYLAIIYRVDPTPVPMLADLKTHLSDQ
ncbi:MAG: bifunctional phosphoglucose/phosphomannose isomerase [Anaerolineales bacterium]|nr:bifunctional phosphoglucose/phosphomannose isomerase [Anaerolineales bacterium]